MAALECEIVETRAYQDYSLERKAEVLAIVAAHDGNVDRAALETGIPHQTIRYWLANKDRFSKIQTQKVADLADECENDARYYFALARSKAHDAQYSQLMTGAAIAVDKMQLLRNQPTSINVNIDLNGDDLALLLAGSLGDAFPSASDETS